MDTFFLSRILTGLTLGFHIIFATVGVGIPLMLVISEGVGIRKKDSHYILLARRWARGLAITVAIGVVTGTIIGLQLSLLWPSFMRIAGHAISLPLFMETFAFFFEAIFLGIYLYTWDRLRPFYHWLLGLPVVLGSTLSAVFITTVNAFMNTPTGFTFENGVLSNVHPLQAMLNPATPTKVLHVLFSAYLTSAFILAAIAAYRILQGKSHVYYWKSLKLCMVGGIVASLLTGIAGDLSGKFLAAYQPEKLAAAEWHFVTQKEAPLILGGILDKNDQVSYALKIPGGLSFLAFNDAKAEVKGLDLIPAQYQPPLFIHYLFDGMIAIGVYLILVSFLFWAIMLFRKANKKHKWLLRLVVLCGPLAMLAIEFGWVFTEIGRQPWIIRGYMLSESGVTTAGGVGFILLLFILLYMFLGTLACLTLIRLFRTYPPEKELEQRKMGC